MPSIQIISDSSGTGTITLKGPGTNNNYDVMLPAAGGVLMTEIPDGGIPTAKLADGAVTASKLSDSSVTTIKLADGAVVNGKLGDLSVTTSKLADSAVITGKIANRSVTTEKIADGAISVEKIANGAITPDKISEGTYGISIAGNAATSTFANMLQTARTINGVPFSGGNNIGFFDNFPSGTQSPGPLTFPSNSIRGFDAYSSTDFPGQFYTGITISGPGGVRSAQLAMNWNSEESAPKSICFRTNDDTSNTSAWSPWTALATKADVDQLKIMYGWGQAANYTNTSGGFRDNANWFDVLPPAGYTMGNLVAFIPSIRAIHYYGSVDGNDSLRCTYSVLIDRIRVWVQNTEQRSFPSANWLAIWR